MKEFRLIEHNLIPLALVFANISILHFIFVLVWHDDLGITVALSINLYLLIGGIYRKNKYLLLLGMLLYILILALSFT